MSTLWSFVRAFAGTDLETVAVRDNELYPERVLEVEPPKTLVALILLECIKGVLAGDEQKKKLLHLWATRWLTGEAVLELWSDRYSDETRTKVIKALILGNVEPKTARIAMSKDATLENAPDDAPTEFDFIERLEGMDWSFVIAEYRHEFKGSNPLEEPFPFFLAQYFEINRLRVRSQVDWMKSYNVARSSEAKKIREDMWEIAYPQGASHAEPAPMTDEEFDYNLAKAIALSRKQNGPEADNSDIL